MPYNNKTVRKTPRLWSASGSNNKRRRGDCILRVLHVCGSSHNSMYPARDCEVVSSDTTSQSYATCSVTRNDGAFGNDWLASLALDFTSESLEYTFLQNFSQPWISPNSDAYVAGMLSLGYHAFWSALMKRLWNETEPISFRASE